MKNEEIVEKIVKGLPENRDDIQTSKDAIRDDVRRALKLQAKEIEHDLATCDADLKDCAISGIKDKRGRWTITITGVDRIGLIKLAMAVASPKVRGEFINSFNSQARRATAPPRPEGGGIRSRRNKNSRCLGTEVSKHGTQHGAGEEL